MNNKFKGISLVIIAATMWGIMGIFVRGLTSAGYTSYDISFLRCLLAGAVYFIMMAITNPSVLKVDVKGLIICGLYGVTAYSVSFISYNISVQRIPVAVATVLMFMSPIWVTILGIIFFREKAKPKNIISIIICLIGAILVANLIGVGGVSLDAIGIIAGVINGFGTALQIMIPRYFAKQYKKDTMLVYGFLGAALMLAFFTDFGYIGSTLASANAGSLIFNIFGIAILCTMVANVSYVKSTQYVDTTTTSILSALQVVVGALAGFIAFNEKLILLQVLGAIIIIVGSLGPQLLDLKNNKAHN